MAVSKYTVLSYSGTNYGALYLEDIGVRPQLGKGVMGKIGQDIVINPGDIIAVVTTGDVLLSREKGTLKKYSDAVIATDVDSLAGITGLPTRAALTGRKTDPAVTVGDF
jgi:hypothetical protein